MEPYWSHQNQPQAPVRPAFRPWQGEGTPSTPLTIHPDGRETSKDKNIEILNSIKRDKGLYSREELTYYFAVNNSGPNRLTRVSLLAITYTLACKQT